MCLRTFFCLFLFPIAVIAKPIADVLPEQTPLIDHQIDDDLVVVAHKPDGTRVYNVFEVAMQAIQGKQGVFAFLSDSEKAKSAGLKPRMAIGSNFGDEYQQAAFKWLQENAVELGDGLIWYYRFDNAYNDVFVKAPWGSAFGQAHVIQAYQYAYDKTNSREYLDLALKAAKPFFMPVSEGGFQSKLPDGSVFFEEVPDVNAAHILNGHMISVVTLLKLADDSGDSSVRELAKQGLDTIRKNLHLYDLGYWSRYDLNPKKQEIIFRLNVRTPDFTKDVIAVDEAFMILAGSVHETRLDVGAPDDAEGAWRISGLEWGAVESIHGKSVRVVKDGYSKNCKPVKGGSLQNAYLIMRLPERSYKEGTTYPLHYLRIDYFDMAPGEVTIEVQDISHGNFMNFRPLANSTIKLTGAQEFQSVWIPVTSKDIAWFMGPDYQAYHVSLLEELYELSQDLFFREYANRWQGYLNAHSEVNAENFLSSLGDCTK